MLFSLSLVVAMLVIDPGLTLQALAPVPIAMILAHATGRWVARRTTSAREAIADLTSAIQEYLAGVRVLRLFGRADAAVDGVGALSRRFAERNLGAIRLKAGLPPIYTTLMTSGVLLVVWHGSERVIAGPMTVGAFVAYLELFLRTIVDAYLTVGRSDGLPLLAVLYLAAAAGVQAMTVAYSCLTATIAQGVLSALRVRLFAHVQRLPTSYFDRVPMGDVISRCTADIETLDTVFSSNVALVLANLVRLVAITIAMLALSVPLTLVAALVVPPLALVTWFLQRRVRQTERDSRRAVGAITIARAMRPFGRPCAPRCSLRGAGC